MSFIKRKIYFHEDDYCQTETLPIGSWEHCHEQLKEIFEFSNLHKAPGGMGWTDTYIRGGAPKKLSMLGMRLDIFKGAFEGELKCFKNNDKRYPVFRKQF